MKRYTFQYLSMLLVLLGAGACDAPQPEPGGNRIEQSAQLNNMSNGEANIVSASRSVGGVISEPEVLSHSFELSVSLYKPAEQELSARLRVSEEAAKSFQEFKGTAYPILPSSMIKLPDEVKVEAGSVSSEQFAVDVRLTEDIPMNTPYLFAIELISVSEGRITKPGNVAYFTVERYEETPSVNKVIRLTREDYLEPEKQFPNGVSSLTMEALVYVEKFRSAADVGEAQISTLMGIEGATLLRFGDAGVPGNQLQAAGQRIDFTFQENKWYHIAFTSDMGNTKVYVNGEEVASYFKYSSLSGGYWYIGRSWSDNRGLLGRLAEVRVWGLARSKAELTDNMYLVNPSEEGLLAYWKMNDVKDKKIVDLTGNGYNLIQKGQSGKIGVQEPVILTLEEPVDVGL